MILIDDKILSVNNDRIKFFSPLDGQVLLSRYEMAALEYYFEGIGINLYSGRIVTVPPRQFDLILTDERGPNVVAIFHDCLFDPGDDLLLVAGEMIPVRFTIRKSEIIPVHRSSDCGYS